MTVRQAGFTLIELLIVIAIIGILSAALISSLLSARNRAFDAAAQSCAKELLIQAEAYRIDSSTYTGFDGTGPFLPRSCEGDSVVGFTITTADDARIEGIVTSKSLTAISFSNEAGVSRP
jgi:prepilin-type N-terminal cleavage/methylation domain-containing protein